MIDGKRYLIIKKQENGCYPIKLAYWFEERITKYHTYIEGFYHTEHYYFPHKNVIKYIDMDKLPKFTQWKVEEPIEGERYLVYRVGKTSWYSPHYTIRKYHNGSFGSADVKYWIKLSELIGLFEGKNMGDGLSVVDIGSFCLLTEKYKSQIEEAGINNNSKNNKMFLKKCSRSISDQLKIMDECQKILYEHGYRKEDVEHMRKVRDMFKEGVETMQEVLKAFCIALDE